MLFLNGRRIVNSSILLKVSVWGRKRREEEVEGDLVAVAVG